MTETIYINKNDDLATIVEKFLISKAGEIILVIPGFADIARSLINFKILAREAAAAGKSVFIDSDDERVASFAKRAGFQLIDDYHKEISRTAPVDSEQLSPQVKHISDIVSPSKEGEESEEELFEAGAEEKIETKEGEEKKDRDLEYKITAYWTKQVPGLPRPRKN